jgi:hypothetical protein
MDLTEGSETSAKHNLTPGKHPKEHIQDSKYDVANVSCALREKKNYLFIILAVQILKLEPNKILCLFLFVSLAVQPSAGYGLLVP